MIIIAFMAIAGAVVAYIFTRPPTSPVTPSVASDNPTSEKTDAPNGSITPKTLDSDKNNTFTEPTVSDPSCLKPSRADYILDGDYNVAWTTGGSRYEGILRMSQDRGKLAIKYFNPQINSQDFVMQDMRLMNCTQGLLILGYNPRRFYANSRHPSYSADNFMIRRETNSSQFRVVNVDDQLLHAPVELVPVK